MLLAEVWPWVWGSLVPRSPPWLPRALRFPRSGTGTGRATLPKPASVWAQHSVRPLAVVLCAAGPSGSRSCWHPEQPKIWLFGVALCIGDLILQRGLSQWGAVHPPAWGGGKDGTLGLVLWLLGLLDCASLKRLLGA